MKLHSSESHLVVALAMAGATALLVVALAMAGGSALPVNDPETFAFADGGPWSPVVDWPMIPINMALTPEGNVMSYGTDIGGNATQSGDMNFDVWIPALGTGAGSHSTKDNGPGTDLFCSIQVIDPISDVILTAGGDQPDPDNDEENQDGTNEVTTYSTSAGMQAGPSMAFARWYPTANTLPDGRILVEGGSTNGFDDGGVLSPEIYTSGQGWTTLTGINSQWAYGDDQKRWWYPRSWVAPDGRVFGISGTNMYWIDYNGAGSLTQAGTFPGAGAGSGNGTPNISATSTAVMYRPGKILQVGGGAISNNDYSSNGSSSATIVDINSGNPVLTPAASLEFGRHWGNATVLPDGDVLVTGGTTVQNIAGNSDSVGHRPELWDPDTDTWTTLPAEQEYRMYHSAALLLPDATVLVGGGGADGNKDEGIDNDNAQIFSPPYLFNGDQRPSIISAPDLIWYGRNFDISVSSDVQKVTLIRMGAVTHSFNSGQRFMELAMSGSGTNRTVVAPANGNLAPPGSYMLFGLNAAGTPSVASLIEINPAGTGPQPPVEPPEPTLTDSQFVTASYSDVLGRSPSSAERAAALATIASQGRAEQIEDLLLLNTAEGQSRAAIARLYRAFFLREPDLGGFNYWYGQSVTLGYDPNPISYSFSVQPEFVNRYGNVSNSQFLDLVYANVLGRSPDVAGQAYWINLMDTGQLNRGQVMIWFSEGQENKNNVDGRILTVNTHRALLNRMPSASEISAWENVLNVQGGKPSGNPQAVSNLIDQLLASAEWEARYN